MLEWVMGLVSAPPSSLPAQDLWGMGCMLAELLLGCHPFHAQDEAQASVTSESPYEEYLNYFDSGSSRASGLDFLASRVDSQGDHCSEAGSELQHDVVLDSSSADQVEEHECVD